MMISTPGWTSGLPALPILAMRPLVMRDVGLDDPPMVDDQRVGNDGIDRALRLGCCD